MMWRRGDVASVDSVTRAAIMPLTGDLSRPPFVLEHQAAAVWHVLSPVAAQEAEIIAAVAQLYRLDPQDIAADVSVFLTELAGLGLALAE